MGSNIGNIKTYFGYLPSAGHAATQPGSCPGAASPRSWTVRYGHTRWSDTRAPFLEKETTWLIQFI